ncbi:MAG: hypothetical protein JWO98_5147 [Frankiales bacterium]|nr:hypothetical protein [Frankiales bacterium]
MSYVHGERLGPFTGCGAMSVDKLRGTVTRLTVRRLKSGGIRHDTRIDFIPEEAPWLSVRVMGTVPVASADRWRASLLDALRERYVIDSLPAERWHAQTHAAPAPTGSRVGVE